MQFVSSEGEGLMFTATAVLTASCAMLTERS